ncbi:MAG: asparagine synthase (glutamine-hydrolyzing) [Ketobacteraceae bacterium]|nr:asparagine synthase (glutamine-hydrolyzing) [Ketobacteraceae bacterium]
MCGIAGAFKTTPHHQLLECLKSGIARRGPDDNGVWVDEQDRIALVHTRLSIIDLSPMGKQPMLSASERYVVSFNGEIYNHHAIRNRISQEHGQRWRGHSDTEVLVAAIEHWGFAEAIRQCNGMFAIAAWDRQEKKLYLTRDPMGEKPLYLGQLPDGGILFASELNAIAKADGFNQTLNPDGLAWLLRLGYIPAPCSIYRNIFKIPQGCYLVLDSKNDSPLTGENQLLAACKRYWDVADTARTSADSRRAANPTTTKARLHQKLLDATRIRMEADVPLGAFLSGGFDSSLVVGMMQKLSDKPIKTFCIGFREQAFDESPHAEAVARHIGTDHTTLFVTANDALNIVEQLPQIYQEPFADASQIPSYLLCKLAREHVTVALTGDGGDELFFGYDRYFKARKLWKLLGAVPRPLRTLLANMLMAVPEHSWDSLFRWLKQNTSMPGFKLHRFASRIMGAGVHDFHRMLRSHWLNTGELVRGSQLEMGPTPMAKAATVMDNNRNLAMILDDQLDYLPDDVLVKVDRASMAVALETRIPLLDPDVVSFSWQIPLAMKTDGTKGKLILREIIKDYVPLELLERPKQGFGVPIHTWLNNELREWAEWLLSEAQLQKSGLLNPRPIRQAWEQQLKGSDWSQPLWNVLMFQAWLAANHTPGGAAP